MRRVKVLIVLTSVSLLVGVGCAPMQTPYLQALMNFINSRPTVMFISVPEKLRISRLHQTAAGNNDVLVETDFSAVDLKWLPEIWGPPMARTLSFFRPVEINQGWTSEKWVNRLATDPRRDGRSGYRLLLPYRPQAPVRDPLAPQPPSEADLDDPFALRCLVRGEAPLDNLPAPVWHGFEPRTIRDRFHGSLMLLISMEHLTVVDTGARPRVSYRLGAYLVDLKEPLLAATFSQDFDGTRMEGPGGVEAALCGSLAELQAGGWAALRRSLEPVGVRYGFVLAAQFGWINAEHLAEEVVRWKKENEQQADVLLKK